MPRPIRRIKARIRDLASLLRPWFLVPSILGLIAGVLLGLHRPGSELRFWAVVAGSLVVGPLVGGGCVVYNQVMDFAWDSHNPTKRRLALVRMRFGIRTAYVMAFVLLAAGLALSAYLGIGALIAASAGAFLGFAYSHPLTRLKEHPPLNFISGGLCYGILPVLLGWSLVASLTWPSLFAGIPSVIVISSGYILIGLPDIPNRRSPRAGTLPATFDHRRAVMTSMLLVGVAGAITAVFVLVGWYPSATLLVVPVLVSIMAMHYRLLDPGIAESSFLQLRYLYVVLGMIFLTSLAM